MHHRAGRAIKAVLEGAVDEAVRNEAAFRLARIHFQKGQLDDALHALGRIQGTVPSEDPGRRRVPAGEHLHGDRPAGRGRQGARAAAERREPGRVRRLQPRHRAAAGRAAAGRDRAAGQGRAAARRRPRGARNPRQVQPRARHHPVRVGRLRTGGAVAGPRPPRRTVLEPGAAAGGLGRSLGRAVRPGARGRGTSWPTASRRTWPSRKSCSPCRMRTPAEPARPRRDHVRARARAVQHPDRQGRRLDPQHQGRAVPRGADPRGEPGRTDWVISLRSCPMRRRRTT
jgi:hypothetical protein